ncbi:MAG: Ig-like domain-containing protein [Candidatus Firestonebacteria bacterium]|nr:Ig-like domain-containing protein [Candidatus Firestonebacteria bacterium]
MSIYTDADLTKIYDSASGIQEGVKVTIWNINKELVENTRYRWRAWSCVNNINSDPMSPSSFFVNKINEPPAKVTLSNPPDRSSIDTTEVKLEVNNGSDPDNDKKTYDFKVYDNNNFLVYETTFAPEGQEGITMGIVQGLLDNSWYSWKARAVDEHGLTGEWMDKAVFFINTSNDAPETPTLISPSDNSEVANRTPVLEINSSQDKDGDKVSYYFEIDTTNNFTSSKLIKSNELFVTLWQTPELDDNTIWYWRVRATDGVAYSSWMNAKIFVNINNDAPSVPVLISPKETVVTMLTPELKVQPSIDIDGDKINYEYKVYDTTKNPVTGADNKGISWIIDMPLADNGKYFWQAQAKDEHDLVSGWSDFAWFIVNQGNDAPTAPKPARPENNSTIGTQTPDLEIINSTDLDGDNLTYYFEIFDNDQFLGEAKAKIEHFPENPSGKTTWNVDTILPSDKKYYWRAKAHDGKEYGGWSETFSFTIASEVSDTTPPNVSSVNPGDKAEGVSINSNIIAIFSEPMDVSTINTATFILKSSSEQIEGDVISSEKKATFIPSSNLAYSTKYIGKITTEAKDLAGNKLSSDYTWSFTTESQPPTGRDDGKDGKKPCIITNAIPENSRVGVIKKINDFKDRVLIKNIISKYFVELYYKISPYLVNNKLEKR